MILSNIEINIYEGMFLHFHWLGFLNMTSNGLQKIPNKIFIGLIKLFEMDLSFNLIIDIDDDAFEGLISLKILNLANNHLKTIHRSSLSHLTNLRKMIILNNDIKTVEQDTFNDLLNIETLYSDEFRFCGIAKQADVCLPKPDEFSSCEDLMANYTLQVCRIHTVSLA